MRGRQAVDRWALLCEILLNYVSPDARFRGVSKRIIAGLEAHASALGVERVTLTAWRSSG